MKITKKMRRDWGRKGGKKGAERKTMYDVIRFYRRGARVLMFRKITERQAKEWCSHPKTKKDDVYFDGFNETGVYLKDERPAHNAYFSPTLL